ncbi:anthranilate synthase component I [Bacillus sp. 03113]|uniref:anthranilate synthase component I n=1 Tax=Bacillus sp. 03113 TaxID=2578211 RepID=UPI001141C319|nr:anthranilate synthase component I [Bacillus sp. 03113]
MVTTANEAFIMEELGGDTITPISIYQKVKGKKKFLLESSLKHEKSGRYSFIGANPSFELKGFGSKSYVVKGETEQAYEEKPLDLLKKLLPKKVTSINTMFPLIGGAVGYVGYDVIRQYENIGKDIKDELEVPDVHLMFFEDLVVFDHLDQKVFIVSIALDDETTTEDLKKRIESRKAEILMTTEDEEIGEVVISDFQPMKNKERYEEMVRKAKEYIVEGDIFQVVPSHRLSADFEGKPFDYYRKLRVKNQSPYMYFLDYEDYAIVGSSPESLIKATDGRIVSNPIAGSRPRGKTVEEDLALEKDLLSDEKELAEHKMLVDLARNDIGKVSEFGSVQVDKYIKVEKYRHIMHLVSEVSGKLKEDYSAIDALISCLPAGTVSGAPKIRAMEIINELEDSKRGVYSGAVGYFSANGNMDVALAIRTMVIKDQKAYIQAGAGIVYDSVPEKEYEETIHKLRVFLEGQK